MSDKYIRVADIGIGVFNPDVFNEKGYAKGWNAAFEIVMKTPAADVRPVVRGEWEDVSVRDYSTNVNGGMELHIASMFCPVCKRWHNEVYHYGNPIEFAKFCSFCGAQMSEAST